MLLETKSQTNTRRKTDWTAKGISIYGTAPSSKDAEPLSYLERVRETARWSEDAGCTGSLVYTDNGLVDPWLVAGAMIAATRELSPLVAVQPIYMHPYSVAKMVTTLSFLHGRRINMNLVAGGFKGDLTALNDQTAHDQRYDRLVEYTTIIQRLLRGEKLTFDGEFYSVQNLSLTPGLPPELYPEIFLSGSSEAGLAAARRLGAVAVQYPEPVDGCRTDPEAGHPFGIRVGVIARDDEDEAWRVADERFPIDRRGQAMHKVAMSVSDSKWHQQLSATGAQLRDGVRRTYWLGPFENYKTFCPYLVGNYEAVAGYLRRYLDAGYSKFILDIPPSREELTHTMKAFEMAQEGRA